MDTNQEVPQPRKSFFREEQNRSTRIDVFSELSLTAEPALRQFFRRSNLQHYFDEVLLPTLKLGDAQVFVAVRDRPWPPWGLGARQISAVCEVHSVAPDSWAVSPVYMADEDITNIGLICAVYKEVLQTLAASDSAEICYLVVEGSSLISQVLLKNGFRCDEDVFMTEQARYFTYRANVRELLKRLDLSEYNTPALLVQEFTVETMFKNALFHNSLQLAGRAELVDNRIVSELIILGRGGHASKPGGVPGGSGTDMGTDQVLPPLGIDYPPYVALSSFLGDGRHKVLEEVLARGSGFRPATVLPQGESKPVVDEQIRRAKTLLDVEFIEDDFFEALKGTLEPALKKIGISGFPVGRIEMQVTASSDGDYYRMHRDSDATSTRAISFVYFFHREPRRFSGGELRIYSDKLTSGGGHADSSELLSPRQDMLVIFPSHAPHELLPVRVPTHNFAHSRFTINGWIHRAK